MSVNAQHASGQLQKDPEYTGEDSVHALASFLSQDAGQSLAAPKAGNSAQKSLPDQRVVLGRVLRPHGIRGELKIESFSDPAPSLFQRSLWIDGEGAAKEGAGSSQGLAISGWSGVRRIAQKPAVFVAYCAALQGTREDLLRWRGALLWTWRSLLEPPSSGDVYYVDMIGQTVWGAHHQDLGRVRAIHDFGAGVLLEVWDPQGHDYEYVSFQDVTRVDDQGVHVQLDTLQP